MSEHGTVPAGWYPDPEGRFEHRYYNGETWTRDVSIDGRRYFDDGSSPMRAPSPPPQRGATAAMVIGIIAATVAWLPVLFVAGIGGGIAAVAVGITVRRRGATGTPRTFATIGAIAGTAALALSAVGVWFTVVVYRAVDAYQRPASHEIDITSCQADGRTVTVGGTITNVDDDSAGFTLRLEIDRADSTRTLQSVTHEVDDIEPGQTRSFEVRREIAGAEDIECRVERVDGPLPFGIDIN